MKNEKPSAIKRKIPLIVAAALVLAMLAYAIYYVAASSNKTTELPANAIITVDRGDLVSKFQSSATVTSGQQGAFAILDGVKVNEVNVRVGDSVQKGDVLATFDTTTLNDMLRIKKNDYDAARKAYADYKKSAADAPKQSRMIAKEIAALEKTIAELQAAETDSPAADAPASENAQLESLKTAIAGLLGNTRTANRLVDSIFAENGSVAQTITAFQNLLSGSMISSDFLSQMGGMSSMMNSDLINASLQLVQLKVQQALLGVQSGASLESVYQSVEASAAQAYEQAQATVEAMKNGWVAAEDGIVREINVVAGQIYTGASAGGSTSSFDITTILASLSTGSADIGSMLSGLFSSPAQNGAVIEYYPFAATFVLGKYDLAKVKLDQAVRVTSVSGKVFDASVVFISPVASESSDLNISSLLGSSGSSKGVEARIVIPEPDRSITIGLDVEVSIDLETRENTVRVPVESVQYDEESKGYYVFVYEAVSKTIQKQLIETGLFDENYYEVTKGLDGGEQIVRAPQRSMVDGEKVKVLA